MKKLIAAVALMSLSTGAALATDATDFIKESKVKSNVTRAEVIAKVAAAPTPNAGDATAHVPEAKGSSNKTRADVLATMKGHRFVGSGDATAFNAWVKE